MAKTSKSKIRIPFDKEEGGGSRPRFPEGDYLATIKSAKPGKSSEKETPGVFVTFEISEGKFEGKEITDRLWITPKSLFRIRLLLEAAGMKVPKKAVNVDLAKLKGKEVGLTLTDDDPYEGKISSKIADYIDPETIRSGGVDDDDDEDLEDDDDEDEDSDDEDSDDSDDELDVDLDEELG